MAAVAEAKKRWVPPPPSPPSPAARSSPTAAATDPFPRVQGQKQAPSFKRPRPAWSASQEQEEGEGDEEDEKVGEQRGRGYKSANDTDGGEWQVPIQTADDDRQRGDSKRTRTGREISDGESAGAVCVGRDDGADAGPEKSSRPRDGDAAASDVNGDGDDLPHQETVARGSDGGGCGVDGGGGSGSSQEDPGEESSQPAARDGWRPRKRDLVEVERRMTPGVNKPGGTARVVRVDAATGAVDVRYVVEGGWERGIDPRYVSLATLELNEKRSTLGRCIHCGSLRVDCRQECEFFTAPAPHLPPFYLSGNFADGSEEDEGRLGRDAGKTTRRWRERERERERERLRHRRRRRHRRPRRPSEGGSGDAVDRAGQRSESQKRRRRLPEDCDEEGDPVLGSSQEAKEGARDGDSSDDDADSDAPTRGNGQQRSSRLDRRLADSSSGSSSTDGGTVNIEGPGRRRLDGRPDKNGSGTGPDSDSDAELLGVWHSTSHGNDGGGSSRGRFFNRGLSLSDGSEASESEQDQEEVKEDRNVSLSNHIVRRNSKGDVEEDNAGSGGGAIEARFLQAEGEEDALPPDIQDPTSGVKDRKVLRKELQRLLKQLEERDATELEEYVGAVCR